MDRNRKKQLAKLFEAPEPTGKREFFRKMELQPVGTVHILRMQFAWISRWLWMASALLFGSAVYMNQYYEKEFLGAAISVMPFLAMSGMAESTRSAVYGMEELELSTRFSLKSVLLARLIIVGGVDLLLTLVLAWMIGGTYGDIAGQGSFWQTVIYLFAPYLLTAYGSFLAARTLSGRDELYACAAIAAVVSGLVYSSTTIFQWIYQAKHLFLWIVAVGVLGCLTFYEGKRKVELYGISD